VLVVILLIAVLVVMAAAGLVIWIRRAASCERTVAASAAEAATEPEQVFNGDVMCRYVVTSGSFARMEFHDWGVRIRGVIMTRWIVPTWEATYSELGMAELVASKSRIAVWLRMRGEPDGFGFLTTRSKDILQQLEQHEVQVSRAAAQPRRVAELYPPR
jgi:hypothetical protein